MSATSSWPVPWNVAAAMMRIAALMKSADISATAESIDAKRIASRLALERVAVLARLHDRRVQVQVVRHHRRAEDADRDVEHVRVAQDLGARDEADRDRRQVGPRQPELDRERPGDQHDQRDDERLDVAEAAVLQEQHDQHVERREADAPDQRQAEQQVERDGRADHFGEIAGGDRDLAEDPQHDRRPAASSCRGRPARGRGRWRCRAAPASACSRIAIRLEIMITLSSV